MAARQLPIWSAPLAPVALALTAGILLDRFCIVPFAASLIVALVSLLAWLIFVNTSRQWLALVYLMGGVASAGSAYHHWHRHHVGAADLSRIAERETQAARLRGVLASAPIMRSGEGGPLRSFPTQATTRFVLRVQTRQDLASYAWHDADGLVQVTLIGRTDDVTVGDEVELLGRLALPGDASNPGEFDYAAFLRDQGITTTLTVLQSDEVILVRRGWPTSLFGLLAVVRGWGQRTLARDLSSQHGVAAALLLGEGADMSGEDWEQYLRTGVIHVLAISGQHLVILAGFLWLIARAGGFRRRHAAPMIALLLIGYALLTGGRPPVMRAAWVMAAFAGGILLQRPVAHANTFALAWIGVIAVNPMRHLQRRLPTLVSRGGGTGLGRRPLGRGAGRSTASPDRRGPLLARGDRRLAIALAWDGVCGQRLGLARGDAARRLPLSHHLAGRAAARAADGAVDDRGAARRFRLSPFRGLGLAHRLAVRAGDASEPDWLRNRW